MSNNIPQTTTIDALWQALHDDKYLDANNTTLNLPAQNQLGSPSINTLLSNAGLFPAANLAMTLTGATHVNTIVLTGVLQGTFLGATNPAATVIFFLDSARTPQLSVTVTTPAGYTLKSSFAALKDSVPGEQAFSAASFAAVSDGAATLTFTGTPTLGPDLSGLWTSNTVVTGAVTLPAAPDKLPTFTLQQAAFTTAPFGAGNAPFAVQLVLSSDPVNGASGAVQGQVSITKDWPAIPVVMTLPVSQATGPSFYSDVSLSQPITDLLQLAPLFLGQALANLIPARFPIGNTFSLTALELDLGTGSGALSSLQINVTAATKLELLPAHLADLEQVVITFVFDIGSPSLSVIFNGEFMLAATPVLTFNAGFSLPDCQVVAANANPIDVGALIGAFIPGLDPPRAQHQLTIETLSATLSPIEKTYTFSGDVTFGDDWSIDIGRGVKALALTEVSFAAVRTSQDLSLAFGATIVFLGSDFNLTAQHPGSGQGWIFTGTLSPDTPLYLVDVATELLPFVPSKFVPHIKLAQLSGSFDTLLGTYMVSATLQWKLDFAPVAITADFLLQSSRQNKNDKPTFSGYVHGKVDINKLELDVAYIFSPTSQDLIFKYRELTIDYHRDDTDPYVSISLGHSSVGSLVDFLLSFADPGNDFKLSAPWDALEKISLPDLTVKVHLKTKEIDVEVDMSVNLGFIEVTKFTLSYVRQYGKANLNVGLYGTFLGEDYKQQPLGWDLLNDPAPAVPGGGTQVFDLEYFGMGQHLSLREAPPATMDGVIKALENALTPVGNPTQNPANQLPGLMFNAGSNWLIGTRFTVMSTLELSVVFNDPALYGVLIQMSGSKAGIFAGLRFEILYRKISDSIGVYHIELTLPDAMRHLEFGEVSITLPIVTIDVYTNGNFRIDFGFPPSLTDFSRSFSVQVFPFVGFGGFYFALLDGQTSTNVPKIDNGDFKPVIELGFALQVGVGKDISVGILSGGISITVGGMVQGVLAWYHPEQKNMPTEMFFKMVGTIAIVGEVYATVNFGIIEASVSLTVYISVTLDIERYKAILIEASAGVDVKVSIKILFVRIHFSFSATITESFTIGSDSATPWHVVSGGGGGTSTPLKEIARGSYRARGPLPRPIPHALLRRRPPRALVARRRRLRSFAAVPQTTIDVTAMPLVSQALVSDFTFPGGPSVPQATSTAVVSLLLGVATSNGPTGFNQLMTLLLDWTIDAIGHEHYAVSAAVLDEVLDALKQAGAADRYFSYTALQQLFTDNNLVFNLIPRPATPPSFPVHTVQKDETLGGIAGLDQYHNLGLTASALAVFNQTATGLLVPNMTIAGQTVAPTDTFATIAARANMTVAAVGAAAATTSGILQPNATLQLTSQLVELAFMAMIPAIQLDAPGYSIKFWSDRTPVGDYEAQVQQYFTDLMAQFATSAASAPRLAQDLANESLATFIFRNYFLMLARSAVQSAKDALRTASYTVTDPGTTTFTTIANSFNTGYTVRASDSPDGIAAMFGLSTEALEAANPALDFKNLVAGETIFIPALTVKYTSQANDTASGLAACFGMSTAELQAANPGVNFNPLPAGTVLSIPALRIAHTSLEGETAQAIAAEFAISLSDLAAANPGVSLNPLAANTALLIPLRVSPVAIAAANQTSSTILAAGAVMALGDIPIVAASTDSLSGLAAQFGVQLTDLMTANQESRTLLNPGQVIAFGDLSATTRAGDSLNGLAAYWGYQGDDIGTLADANLSLTLLAGQTLTIPLAAGNKDYLVQPHDTIATLKAQGATIVDVAHYNSSINLDPGQAVALPKVQHVVSTSYFVAYTSTTGDTLESVARAFFLPDMDGKMDAAKLSIAQWNGLDPTKPYSFPLGTAVRIPYASSLANIGRVYHVSIAQLAANPARKLPAMLAPRAPIVVPKVSHTIAAGETLAAIAQSYDLSIEQVATRIALQPGLFAATALKVPAVPGMKLPALNALLASSGGYTNAANMTSRFMLHGLRLLAPKFSGQPDPSATDTYPFYALIGQEFPVTATPSPLTLTPDSTVSWVQTSGGSLNMPLTPDEMARVQAFQTLPFQSGVAPSQVQPLALYSYVPDRQSVRQIKPWLTPDIPDGLTVSAQKTNQPSLWPLPDALIGALAASPQGALPYQAAVGHQQTDGSVTTDVLQATRWATTVDITIQRLPDPVPGTYLMMGADQDGMQRLLAVWAYLAANRKAKLYLTYPQQSSTNDSGAIVSDMLDRDNSFLLKTNLSTESHGEPTTALRAARRVKRLTSPPDAMPKATLQESDSTRFLELLWECSVVKSGGYYFRYAASGGKLGLPDTLFQSGRQAILKLVIVLDDQKAGCPMAQSFNNAMLVGDNVDAGASTLLFQAVTHTVAAGDTLNAIATQYAYAGCSAATLAQCNQTIMGLLVIASSVAGQQVGPNDTFASIAARAGLGVGALGTQVGATPGILRPGALMQLSGKPMQTVQPGDTLASIAEEYDFLDPAALAALNATSTTLLREGAQMIVPGQANHPIINGDSFQSIALATGVDVSALGEANSDSPILAPNAQIQIAGNQLRMTATLPPGHVGFSIVRPNPQPADPTKETAQQALDALYNLVGFQVEPNTFFAASKQGLPAGPGNDAAAAQDTAQWNYRQILAVSKLAIDNKAADTPVTPTPALPPRSGNPYAGTLPGSNVSLALTFQDILGNRTQGSSFNLQPDVGYTDEIVALSAWPSVTTSYRFFKPVQEGGANFSVNISVAPDRYLPGAASGNAAANRAQKDAAHYQTISYQLQQHDVTCWLSTTLGGLDQPDLLGAIARASLLGTANASYVFLNQAATLQPIQAAGGTGQYSTLAALIDPAGKPAGYPIAYADLAQANGDARADTLFGLAAKLNIPVNAVARAGDIASDVAPANGITVGQLADNNSTVVLAPAVIVATAARTYTVPAGTALCLQAIADATDAPVVDGPVMRLVAKDKKKEKVPGVPGLATSNADKALTPGLTLIFGSNTFTTGKGKEPDTLNTAAAAFTTTDSPVTPADVAAANQYLDGIFPSGTVLTVQSYITRTADTLDSIAPLGPPSGGTGSPVAQMLEGNQDVPDLWPAGTALFIKQGSHTVAEGETLSSIAVGNLTTVEAVLTWNEDQALVGGLLNIPYLGKIGAINWSTYQASGRETFGALAGNYAGWSIQQLGLLNQDVPGLFAATPIQLSGSPITPGPNDTFRTLGKHFSLLPDQFAAAIANLPNLVRAGGVMLAPAMQVRGGETLAAAAQRLGADPAGLAAANACLLDLLPPGQTIMIPDALNDPQGPAKPYVTLAKDAFALLTARINADRNSRKLVPISVAQAGAAASGVTLLACTIMSPPRDALLQAVTTVANAQAILHLSVSLAISRDPARVAPAFANAPRVVSAVTGIAAQPFADSSNATQRSLGQFAQDFEQAFPGLKLATGPDHIQGTSVLAKPSLLGATATKSATGRGLWVVNFTTQGQGFSYAVDGSKARFFGVPPLSIDMWNGTAIKVPTYDSTNGLQWNGKTQNFRSVDPDQWNQSFLAAVDLLLSPSYSVPGVIDTAIAKSIEAVLGAKSDIAKGLKNLVVPIIQNGTTGQDQAREAMNQQLLVALSRLYEVQALVQLPVNVTGGGSDLKTAPQLSGKLMPLVITTCADNDKDHKVDPRHPLAVLAGQCGVSALYLATVIADLQRVIRGGVMVTLGSATHLTNAADTLRTIAKALDTDIPALAAGMTIGAGDISLFLPTTAINVTPMHAPKTVTTMTDVAGWFAVTLGDALIANSERTDFFAPGIPVIAGGNPQTPQAGETLAAFATRAFESLANLAQLLGEVDAGGVPGSYKLNPDEPPRGLQLIPQLSFTTSKAPLASPDSQITTLLSVKDPAAYKSVTLDLDYRVNQLEFDIHGVAGIPGFQSSSWLSFIIPIDEAPNTAGAAGQVQIPIPLRGYPASAVVSDQASESGWPGEEAATEAQWNYRFSTRRQTAAQDQLTVEVRFNTSGGDTSVNANIAGDASRYEGVIEALAGFAAVWPAVSKDLSQLPDLQPGQASPPAVLNAADALSQLVGKVRDAWNLVVPDAMLGASDDNPYIYTLSTLVRGATTPYFSALVLDRQRGSDALTGTPDDFLFAAASTKAIVDALNGGQVPAELTTAFSGAGFALSGKQIPVGVNTAGADWSIVDEQATQSPANGVSFAAPQTYRILLAQGASSLTVYRQVLWPAVRLTPPGANGFLFAADSSPASVQSLNAKQLPADLAAAFSNAGFATQGPVTVITPGAEWLIVDDSVPAAPKTYQIRLAPGAASLTVYLQAMPWLGATQSGARLVFDLADNVAPVSQPLALDMDFYRLNLLLRQNAWGGSYVSRNANLIQGATINKAFVYETPLVMFPTKVTPFFVLQDVTSLDGDNLRDGLSDFFEKLMAAQTAVRPNTQRNIRVTARYWQSVDGKSQPGSSPLAFQVPLVLLPLYPFDVTTDWSPGPGGFCDQLASTIEGNAAAAGIPTPLLGQYVLDVLVYSMSDDNTAAPQPLLELQNRVYPPWPVR